jgi:hypothetical protein
MLRMVQRQEVVRERFYLWHLEAPDVDSDRSCVTQSIGFVLSSPAGITTEQRWLGFRKNSVVGRSSSFGCLVDASDRTVSTGKPVCYSLRMFACGCW